MALITRLRRRLSGRWFVILAMLTAAPTAVLYFVDSDLVGIFFPVRTIALAGGLTATGLLGLHQLRARREQPSIPVYFLAVVTLAFTLLVYTREFDTYAEKELRFENVGVELVGTLYVPRSAGPHPAVVLAHGSLRAPRRAYHLWADQLVRRGVAVYSFDKRGTGASGGVYEAQNNASQANLTLLASDVAAAVEAIRARPEVDPGRVGIVGISMGGWLAPIAASTLDTVHFLVIVSGPPVSVGEEMYYSDQTGSDFGASAAARARADSLTMLREPSGFDPRPLLLELSIPSLWLFGDADSSIPVVKSIGVLDSLASRHQRPYRYVRAAGAEHLGISPEWPFDVTSLFWDEMEAFITSY